MAIGCGNQIWRSDQAPLWSQRLGIGSTAGFHPVGPAGIRPKPGRQGVGLELVAQQVLSD
jgi:hypothetical protein